MLKRIISIVITLLCVFSIFALSTNAAGNISDTLHSVSAAQNSGGTPYCTSLRAKTDDTSVYVKNSAISGGAMSCWVNRSNSASSGGSVDRFYGVDAGEFGASQNQKYVPKGTYYYLPNYVYEDGYRYAGVGFIMHIEGVYYEFLWSPDSI